MQYVVPPKNTKGTPPVHPSRPPGNILTCAFLAPLIIASILFTIHCDTPVDKFICHSLTPALKQLAQHLSHSAEGQWPVLAGILTLLIAKSLKKHHAHQLGIALLLCPAIGGLTATVARDLIGRARPEKEIPEGWYGPLYQGHWTAGSYNLSSFPSGHSATAGAAAASLIFLGNRFGWILALWAGGVAWSRIALHCHHYSDTYTGLLAASLTIRWLHKSQSPLARYFRNPLHRSHQT